jgi:hypothetical protein
MVIIAHIREGQGGWKGGELENGEWRMENREWKESKTKTKGRADAGTRRRGEGAKSRTKE